MAGLNPLFLYDWSFADFAAQAKALADEGQQPLSLSMYGDPANPRFASSSARSFSVHGTVAIVRRNMLEDSCADWP